MGKNNIKKELALIYSVGQERTLFLMVKFPEKIITDYIGQYILITTDKPNKKELFYIGLNEKPTSVAIDDMLRFEQVLNKIKLVQNNSSIIKLSKQSQEALITSNGDHIPHGIERLRHINGLFKQLKELAPSKKYQDLTKIPLPTKPPPGFQQSYIEFPLRKLQSSDLEYCQEKIHGFLHFLRVTGTADLLKRAIRMSAETYNLLKLNSNPKLPLCLILKNSKKTYFQELQDQGWEIIRIYGHEQPSMPDIVKMPRAYLAIQPQTKGVRKVIVAFMGTENFPRLAEETWWSNDRRNQSEIWAKTNFFHSYTQHTGIQEYGKIMNANIEKELFSRISSNDIRNVHFELTGHSSGGMLATIFALHLYSLSAASIHAFLFATPSFLTSEQGLELSAKFTNNAHDNYTLHTIISHDDPAINIYGPRFIPPENNTIYIVNEHSKDSFLGVYAASKGTTLANIDHHMHSNYQKIVSKSIGQMEDVMPFSEHSTTPSLSKL